jgi:RNA polymerase sigma-70 factor (ECF subfamily)
VKGSSSIDVVHAPPPSAARRTFDDACREAWAPVVRMLSALLPAGADVENAAAACFEIAWRRRTELDMDTFVPWMLGVAANVARNERRGIARRLRLGERLRTDSLRTEPERECVTANDDPQRAIRVLRGMRPADREVLVMHAWEGLESPEIATALGIRDNAAAQRLHRAKRRFEDAWARQQEVEDARG